MNHVREKARALRLRIEAGDLLSIDEAVAACVTMDEALSVFDDRRDIGEGTMPICCGADVDCVCGLFAMQAKCPRCKAEIRDALAPMSSPFLHRGNASVEIPGDEFVKAFGEEHWIVMHEGDRP